MATSNLSTSEALLSEHRPLDGSVDYKGRPIYRFNSGGWRSSFFIIGVEAAERFVFYGISSNLITYLSEGLGESTATAAENVNVWSGTAALFPLLGAFLADSFLGKYRTILLASLVYILGLGLLTLSAFLISLSNIDQTSNLATKSTSLDKIIFYFSLYLVALGQGGHKPTLMAFGADQFDEEHSEESKAKSSFFNWWYFSLSVSIMLSLVVVVYIQDNVNWVLGFGVPCIMMVASLVLFLLGTKTYRFSLPRNENNPFARISRVFFAAFKNWKSTTLVIPSEEEAQEILPQQSSQQFKFLNKALLSIEDSPENSKLCSINDIEEAKALLRLVPIWATCLVYAIVFAQSTTFFTKQGATLDRRILKNFVIPSASLQFFIGVSIIIFIPIYDRIFVPITRTLTLKPSGITMLQRIGIGMLLSTISMIIAALVEMKRREIAEENGLIDKPNAMVPMSVWWLVPQYLLRGLADVFAIVGLQEFFCDQVPKDLRSFGLSLYLSMIGVGSFLSSFLVFVINKATSGDGRESWFANNLNRAHLDYFYWLLAALSAVALATYLYFSNNYIYNRKSNV